MKTNTDSASYVFIHPDRQRHNDTCTELCSALSAVFIFRNKLLDEISPIYSNLENMISSYTKDGFFREKKHGPNSPDFKEQKKIPNPQSFMISSKYVAKNRTRNFFLNNFTFIPST
jgi:hypothetical protein